MHAVATAGCRNVGSLTRESVAEELENRFRRPVVQLILALYGHADAGGFREEHCEGKLVSIGLERLAEEWQGVFWHEKTRSFMLVYFDGSKSGWGAQRLLGPPF